MTESPEIPLRTIARQEFELAKALCECVRDLRIAVEYSGKMGNPAALLESADRADKVLAAHADSAQTTPEVSRCPEGYTLVENGALQLLERRARVMTSLRGNEVWYWQGDGFDYPDSLVCPVVMDADTLRSLLGRASVTRGDAEAFLAEYRREVWDAAYDEDGRTAYDEAGEKLADSFLARFGKPS